MNHLKFFEQEKHQSFRITLQAKEPFKASGSDRFNAVRLKESHSTLINCWSHLTDPWVVIDGLRCMSQQVGCRPLKQLKAMLTCKRTENKIITLQCLQLSFTHPSMQHISTSAIHSGKPRRTIVLLPARRRVTACRRRIPKWVATWQWEQNGQTPKIDMRWSQRKWQWNNHTLITYNLNVFETSLKASGFQGIRAACSDQPPEFCATCRCWPGILHLKANAHPAKSFERRLTSPTCSCASATPEAPSKHHSRPPKQTEVDKLTMMLIYDQESMARHQWGEWLATHMLWIEFRYGTLKLKSCSAWSRLIFSWSLESAASNPLYSSTAFIHAW